MVDCVAYEQIEEAEDQKIFRDYLKKFKTDNLGCIYFDLYIDGKLCEGSQQNYGATIDNFVNPTYNLYEMVRLMHLEYIDAKGGSDIASLSSHYNNNLSIYAFLTKCIPDQEYVLWQQKFDAKYSSKFKNFNFS